MDGPKKLHEYDKIYLQKDNLNYYSNYSWIVVHWKLFAYDDYVWCLHVFLKVNDMRCIRKYPEMLYSIRTLKMMYMFHYHLLSYKSYKATRRIRIVFSVCTITSNSMWCADCRMQKATKINWSFTGIMKECMSTLFSWHEWGRPQGCTAQTYLPKEKEKSLGKTIHLLFSITTYVTSVFWELAEYVSERYGEEDQRIREGSVSGDLSPKRF